METLKEETVAIHQDRKWCVCVRVNKQGGLLDEQLSVSPFTRGQEEHLSQTSGPASWEFDFLSRSSEPLLQRVLGIALCGRRLALVGLLCSARLFQPRDTDHSGAE